MDFDLILRLGAIRHFFEWLELNPFMDLNYLTKTSILKLTLALGK